MTDAVAIEVRGLVKRFGEVVALDGVDLTARPGQVVECSPKPVKEFRHPAGQFDVGVIDVVQWERVLKQPLALVGHGDAEKDAIEAELPCVALDALENLAPRAVLQCTVFLLELGHIDAPLQQKPELVHVHRLTKKVVGSSADGTQGVLLVALSRDDDHFGQRIQP